MLLYPLFAYLYVLLQVEVTRNLKPKLGEVSGIASKGCVVCRCFGSDRAPGVAPQGAFWSRMVLPTVARWFALDARETVDSFVQVRVALRCVTPYVLA
jgi:hypothetical protein